MSKTTRIHVNQHIIKRNRKTGERESPFTVKTYNSNERANLVWLTDSGGNVVARVVYQPGNPLPCGAEVWIETLDTHVEVVA